MGIAMTIKRLSVALALALALGGCTQLPDMDSFNKLDLNTFRPRSVGAMRDDRVRAVTVEDLVDAQGVCAAAPAAEPAPADGQAAAPPSGGIALQMTECEVVRRAGPPERVELGQNERSDRTARMIYTRGDRPGIYGFTAGRLATIERGQEAAPVRPARPARTQPPRRTQG